MEEASSYGVLTPRLTESELGEEFFQNPLMDKDVWSVTELGYSEEEAKIQGTRNFYFQGFSLPWLKLLTKLTALVSTREKSSLSVTRKRVDYIKQFDAFLESKGYRQPDLVTNNLLQEFVAQGNRVHRNTTIAYAVKLWKEEKWIEFNYTPRKYQKSMFCKTSTANKDDARQGKQFEIDPIYLPELLANTIINPWLKSFSEKADLKDKYGNRFYLKSHQFRRTKASIMAYCETEDEYIAAVLGHGWLDMLPHYQKRSLEKLEKDASAKGYVDMYGRVTSFKPRKRRYEKLAELLKVSTPLGECHRPIMLGDCQYRYACLSCDHHRVTLEDKPKLEADFQQLKRELQQAQNRKEERRVTEINRLLDLLKNRLQGLKELKKIKGGKINEKA